MTRSGWLAAVACTGILALSITCLISVAGTSAAGEDGIVSIRGFGNSGNTFYGSPSARRLSRLLKVDRDLPPVTDEELRRIVAAVKERALAGEVEAAHLLVELAVAQRAPAAPAAAPAGK